MPISARELNRATLARQLLLEREAIDVPEAVGRVVGLQAQHPATPYLALWNRVRDFDPADLDRAFTDREVVKATLIRITLHAVHAADHKPFREAMEPSIRSARLNDRFTERGLTAEDADAMLPDLLAFARRPRPAEAFVEWLAERFGARSTPAVWRSVRSYALVHVPTGPPWSFGGRGGSFVAAEPRPVLGAETAAASLQILARRYLEAFGPASIADLGAFAMVPRARARAALDAMADHIERLEGPDGQPLFDVPGAPRPRGNVPAPPRLLPMWDEVLLAHRDRSRVIPPDLRPLVTRSNGDILPTMLVDGQVAGVWRAVDGGIEATAYRPISAAACKALRAEASSLLELLADRDPLVYRRYDHWWAKLPPGEVRVLRG